MIWIANETFIWIFSPNFVRSDWAFLTYVSHSKEKLDDPKETTNLSYGRQYRITDNWVTRFKVFL